VISSSGMTRDSLFDGLKIEDWPGGIESHHFATNRDSQRRRVNSACGFDGRGVGGMAGVRSKAPR
jgi:hypothetical protein